MALSLVAKVEFFRSRFFLKYSFFLSWQEVLPDLLVRDGAGVFLLVGFKFLGLDSLDLDSLAVEPWVYTLIKVFWDGQWPLRQWESVSRTIILDFGLVLAFTLIIFCIISSKLVDARFCCLISILMEGLRPFQK